MLQKSSREDQKKSDEKKKNSGRNINDIYVVQFLACLVAKRRNEREKSLGEGKTVFPSPATQHSVEDL